MVQFEGIAQVVPLDDKIRSVEEFCGRVTASPAPTPSSINRLGGIILPGNLGTFGPDDPSSIAVDIDLSDDVARDSNISPSDTEIQGLTANSIDICEIFCRRPYKNATEVSLNAFDVDLA